ncbi:MAG: pore-forming ESAT-6 family protein [Erysipelotrichaceae bacterium]|nr:pore-forming ESAT-6 family protein [Erysipelotrichaceae bacterium]
MDQIRITLPEVSAAAAALRAINSELDETLAYVSRIMNELSSVWISEGAETLVSRFNQFSRRFAIESETVDAYAAFLDFAVSTYDSLESTITANASYFA